MAAGRSFAEYVKGKCYNGLYQAAEEYVNENWESVNFYTRNVHRIGSVEMLDATVQRVYDRDHKCFFKIIYGRNHRSCHQG